MNAFQLQDTIAWQDLGDGISRQVMSYDNNIMLVKVKFKKGATGVLHQHPHTQISYVESGVFEYTIDGKTKLLKQGDSCYVPSAAMHGCVCLEAGMLIDTFTPCREDFLK